MYNYFMLMGTVSEEPIVEELKDGRKKAIIKLKVTRQSSNQKGEYVADVLNITFWDYLANCIQENLPKYLPIMVKGRMQATEQGIELIGERVIHFNDEQGVAK